MIFKKVNNVMKNMAFVAIIGVAISMGGIHAAEAAQAEYPSVDEVVVNLANEPGTIFPVGGPNVAYEKYFTGKTFHASLAKDSIGVSNVTFTKGAHTYWHIHHGTCQILVPESGRGYYQIWGQEAQELLPGKVVTIPEGVKHWHGAAPGTFMQHLSIMQSNKGVSTEWLEPVDEDAYNQLK